MKPPAAPEATSRLPSAAPRDRAILQAASAPSQSSIVTRAGARGMPGTDRPVVRTAKAEQRRKKAQGKLHLDGSFDIYWCDEFNEEANFTPGVKLPQGNLAERASRKEDAGEEATRVDKLFSSGACAACPRVRIYEFF